MRYEAAHATSTGDRAVNQDRCALAESAGSVLMCLADGMGGHPKGEAAAQILIDTGRRMFREAPKPVADPPAFLAHLMHAAHEAIVAYGKSQGPGIEPRSTAVIALIQKGAACWLHAGDSRLYLFRHGRILTRTLDHSYVELLRQQGAISRDECIHHPYRNYVTRCLGGKMPPMDLTPGGPIPLQPGDILLLCSDGLWGPMDDAALTKNMQAGQPLSDIIERMVGQAQAAASPGSDNITAMALRWIQGAPAGPARGKGGKPAAAAAGGPEDEDARLAQAVEHLRNTIQSFKIEQENP